MLNGIFSSVKSNNKTLLKFVEIDRKIYKQLHYGILNIIRKTGNKSCEWSWLIFNNSNHFSLVLI